jgi:hypothetical protein
MGRGRGSGLSKSMGMGAQAKADRFSLTRGSSLSTGPNQGIGAGPRPGGTPEKTAFKREQIRTRGLDPRGQLVGSFLTEGPSATGEVTLQKGGALEKAVREQAQQVEQEPLPAEQREQLQRFHELLLGGEGEKSALGER